MLYYIIFPYISLYYIIRISIHIPLYLHGTPRYVKEHHGSAMVHADKTMVLPM